MIRARVHKEVVLVKNTCNALVCRIRALYLEPKFRTRNP